MGTGYGSEQGSADGSGEQPGSGAGRAADAADAADAAGVPTDAADAADARRCAGLLDVLEILTRELAALPVAALPDPALEGLLPRLRAPLQRLEGVRARAAAASQERVLSRQNGGASGPVVREHQRHLAEEQQLTPGEVQRQVDAGKAVGDHAGTARALQEGDIGPRHAARIAEVLAAVPPEQRDDVERRLLALAAGSDALAFGRAARRLLASIRPAAVARDERRKHLDRSVKATDTEDGGFAFSGLLYGVAAEQAREAFRAFRRPDARDELRTPAQRAADAFEQLCAAALRSGEAPRQHGVRPQVTVVFAADQYAALTDTPEQAYGLLAGSGQVASGQQLRHLVDDCQLFRIVLDAAGTPIEASAGVRTVPTGLWRALVIRDGGCVWPGCDAPASWCDVAHGNRSHARKGCLSMENAMLLCRRHHRRFDNGSYRVRITGAEVELLRITAAGDVPVASAGAGRPLSEQAGSAVPDGGARPPPAAQPRLPDP